MFHAAVSADREPAPYEVREWEEDGVRLIGVHNRPHGLFDIGNPLRELDDPPITAAFARGARPRLRPTSCTSTTSTTSAPSLIDQAAARGLPVLLHDSQLLADLPAGLPAHRRRARSAPARATARAAPPAPAATTAPRAPARLAEIRARADAGLTAILAVSDAVRRTCSAPATTRSCVDVVRQAMPHEAEIWDAGRARPRARARWRATDRRVPRLGLPAQGPAAARRGGAAHATPDAERQDPRRGADRVRRRSCARSTAAASSSCAAPFAPTRDRRAPARRRRRPRCRRLWWDCAPLAAAECLAARVPLIVPRLGGLPRGGPRRGRRARLRRARRRRPGARQLDRLALEPGLLERLQAGDRAAARVRRLRRRARGLLRRRAPPGADRRRAAPAPSSPCAGRATTASRPACRSSTTGSARACRDRSSACERDGVRPRRRRSPTPPTSRSATSGRRTSRARRPGALAAIVPWEFGAVPRDWVAADRRATSTSCGSRASTCAGCTSTAGVDPERVHVDPQRRRPRRLHPRRTAASARRTRRRGRASCSSAA